MTGTDKPINPQPWLPDHIWDAARHNQPLPPDATIYLAVDPTADPDGEGPAVVIVVQLPCGHAVFL